jgi:hypothetical protein
MKPGVFRIRFPGRGLTGPFDNSNTPFVSNCGPLRETANFVSNS